jgi:predicted dehydrogenase
MSRDVIRWGLLGTARINRSLIPRMKELPRHQLVAVASRDGARARAYAAEWNIPRAHGSYEELLSDPDIDAVYVPLPNALHAEWTVAAARAGKHVLCEKPLTTSLADHDAIEAAARAAGVVVAEAFMYRHHEQTQRVAALVAGGALGTVSVVKGAFTFWLSRERDVRLDAALGGGSLWDIGCYPVSYARTILGQEPVEALGMQEPRGDGVDLTFAGQLRFPAGTLLQFDSGFRGHFRTGIEIVGSEGVLTIPNPFKPGPRETLHLRHGDEGRTIEVEGGTLYSGELEDMADAILLGRPRRVTLADSRGNLQAILALYRSASTGRVERVGVCSDPC